MKRLCIGAALCLGGAWALFAQVDTQTVAVINLIRQEPITVRALKAELAPIEQARGRPYSVPERKAALEELANQRLILQAAERDRVPVSENEIDAALRDYLAQQNGGRPLSDAEYAQVMRQQGANAAAVRQQARQQLLVRKYLVSKKEAQLNTVKEPTDDDIIKWYNLNKVTLVRPDMVRLNLISIPYGANADTKAKAREMATRLAREIGSSPTKFDEIALRGQASDAGYISNLGFYVGRTVEAQQTTGEAFLNIAFSLKQGEVSPLIENEIAYQFIKVTDIYPQKNLELDDVMDPANPRRTVRQYIRQGLLAERTQQVWEQALKEVIADLRKGKNVVTIYDQYLNW
jgi:parvulin-like peptidyl-prolyl isomerase